MKNENGIDFVALSPSEHVCVNLQKEVPKIITKDMFKLEKYKPDKGPIRTRLVIFTNDEKTEFYGFNQSNDLYYCNNCSKLKKYISVKLRQNVNGENYVELGKGEHICKPQKNQEPNLKFEIVRAPNFEVIPATKAKIEHLIVKCLL